MCHSYFVIVCKKRSTPGETIYWSDCFSGYTPHFQEAGRYNGIELHRAGGLAPDWHAEKHMHTCKWRRNNPGVMLMGADCPEAES